jgi:hypothetical protein
MAINIASGNIYSAILLSVSWSTSIPRGRLLLKRLDESQYPSSSHTLILNSGPSCLSISLVILGPPESLPPDTELQLQPCTVGNGAQFYSRQRPRRVARLELACSSRWPSPMCWARSGLGGEPARWNPSALEKSSVCGELAGTLGLFAPPMLSITSATRLFVAVAPIDLRGSFNRLSSYVKEVLAQAIKRPLVCLHQSETQQTQDSDLGRFGLLDCQKRLESGRFSWITGEQSGAGWADRG